MPKSKKIKEVPPTPEQRKEFELKRIQDHLHLIPEPTYIFKTGDRVEIGALQDVYISDVLDNNKIYEIDYTSIDNNYGKPIRHEHCKMFVDWMRIRKYRDNSVNIESFIHNEDLRLNYMNYHLMSLFTKAYSFGINFEPEYQREYVWNLEDKIALIDSIFNHIDIGKFVFIRYDTEKWIDTGFGEEVLDGKQRLKAILDFYEDRFQYKEKHFSDLSHRDQDFFESYPVSVAEVSDLTREQILRYFIALNTCGKIMSKEQINKAAKLLEESEKR